MISRYQDGELLRELATDFHITRQTASIILKRYGIKTRYNLLSDDQLPEIQSAYEAGDSLAALGQRYSVDKSTIHNFLKKHGVQLRKRPGW